MTKKGYIELIEQALSRQNWNNDQNVIQYALTPKPDGVLT